MDPKAHEFDPVEDDDEFCNVCGHDFADHQDRTDDADRK